jgi:cytochrome c oxidase subunit 6a
MSVLARTALRTAIRTTPRRARGFAQTVTESEAPELKTYLAHEKAVEHHAVRELLALSLLLHAK